MCQLINGHLFVEGLMNILPQTLSLLFNNMLIRLNNCLMKPCFSSNQNQWLVILVLFLIQPEPNQDRSLSDLFDTSLQPKIISHHKETCYDCQCDSYLPFFNFLKIFYNYLPDIKRWGSLWQTATNENF